MMEERDFGERRRAAGGALLAHDDPTRAARPAHVEAVDEAAIEETTLGEARRAGGDLLLGKEPAMTHEGAAGRIAHRRQLAAADEEVREQARREIAVARRGEAAAVGETGQERGDFRPCVGVAEPHRFVGETDELAGQIDHGNEAEGRPSAGAGQPRRPFRRDQYDEIGGGGLAHEIEAEAERCRLGAGRRGLHERPRLDRLGEDGVEEVVGAGARRETGLVRGQRDELRPMIVADVIADEARRDEAVEVRQVVIEERGVVARLPQERERCIAVGGDVDGVALGFEDPTDQIPKEGIVLDEENARTHGDRYLHRRRTCRTKLLSNA